MKYIGEHIKNEVDTYRWQHSKVDAQQYINVPEDGNDHAMDAINYGVITHQRRLGIANMSGDR